MLLAMQRGVGGGKDLQSQEPEELDDGVVEVEMVNDELDKYREVTPLDFGLLNLRLKASSSPDLLFPPSSCARQRSSLKDGKRWRTEKEVVKPPLRPAGEARKTKIATAAASGLSVPPAGCRACSQDSEKEEAGGGGQSV
nr:hypothetical protein Iba_chr15fCG1530 [Ipomoea batatas]